MRVKSVPFPVILVNVAQGHTRYGSSGGTDPRQEPKWHSRWLMAIDMTLRAPALVYLRGDIFPLYD
ncbi:MAG: hypothetical protein AAB975_02045, partial [Patescibacteria group bacterium]